MNIFCWIPTIPKVKVGCLTICTAFVFASMTWQKVNTVPHRWGESQSPWKHFSTYVQLSLLTFLPCMVEHWQVDWGEGEHVAVHEEVYWDSISISVLLRMDNAGFPVALSWPQCLKFFNVSTLRDADILYTNHTVLNFQRTAVRLQHMSDLYIILFKEKSFLECLYELEF